MTYIISLLTICGISTAAIMAKAISYVEKAEEAIRRNDGR